MKPITVSFILFLFIIATLPIKAQEKCLVLKPQISKEYDGKCKQGLAHGKGIAQGIDYYEGQFIKGLPSGKGTYKWSNGDSYTGEWLEGFRDGVGAFTYKSGDKDTTITGLWRRDEYKGPVPDKPKVILSRSVDRYSFQKNSDIKNRVLINFYQNGVRNTGIENLLMSTSSGYETRLGESVGYDEVTYPVTIKLSYTTWNKLHGSKINAIFEFKISEPGDWTVDIHN